MATKLKTVSVRLDQRAGTYIDRAAKLLHQSQGAFLAKVGEAQACGLIAAIVLDGSFVTAEPVPHDIDLVLVMGEQHNFSGDLPPAHYNILSQRRVQKRFGFDIVVATNEHETLDQAVAFFQQVRQRPGAKKGLLRIRV